MDAGESGFDGQRVEKRTHLKRLSQSLSFRQARVAVLVAFSLGVVFSIFQIHADLPEPLRTLVVASAVSVDLALKQDSRGFG